MIGGFIRISVHMVCFGPHLYEPVMCPILHVVVNCDSKTKQKYGGEEKEKPEYELKYRRKNNFSGVGKLGNCLVGFLFFCEDIAIA